MKVLFAYQGKPVPIEQLGGHLGISNPGAIHRLVNRVRHILRTPDVIITRGNTYGANVGSYCFQEGRASGGEF